MKTLSILASLALAVVLVGCATQKKVAESEGHGNKAVYNAPFDSVWRASVDAAQRDGLEITSSDRASGYIAARRTVRVHTFGENVGIWVRPAANPVQTEVEVLSRQAGPPVAWFKNWENEIQSAIAANLTRDNAVYGTAPANTYTETAPVVRTTPPSATAPVVVAPGTVVPGTTVVVPRNTAVEQQQMRRIDALRLERDRRESELRNETDTSRREAIGRQISVLDSDLRLEEQRLRDLQGVR